MVQKCKQAYKKFFNYLGQGKLKMIRSSGLIFLYAHMETSNLNALIRKYAQDRRQKGKLRYALSDLLASILLHVLDGDTRFSQYSRNPSTELFHRLFDDKSPHDTAYLTVLQKNPKLSSFLNKILLRYSMTSLIRYCKTNGINRVTIDVDQTAREIHGKQEGAVRGYAAKKKGIKCFQLRVWSVREIKMILKADLMAGSAHSARDVEREFLYIMRMLKKAGITGVFVADSGFQGGGICNLIHENGHYFIIAEKQHQTVKRRGKFARNKTSHCGGQVEIKERIRPATGKYNYEFREVFVKVLSPDGQLWFDFAADKFTNVFVTNLTWSSQNIYKMYKAHAVIETIIEELKNDFGAGIAHSSDFHVNATMAVCSALAYNVKNSFLEEHGFFIRNQEKMKLSTLQSHWIHTPGLLVKNANRKVLRIGHERYDIFEKMYRAA